MRGLRPLLRDLGGCMRPNNLRLILFFLFAAFVLRVLGIWDFPTYRGIESMHVPAAKNYVATGQNTPDTWYQPPMKHILLMASINVFGDNPLGWRLRNVILGSLSCGLLIMLCLELFGDRKIASAAGLMYLLDPLQISISRSSYEDPAAVFFFLLCLYCVLLYVRGKDFALPLAGMSLGAAFAARWYYIPAAIPVFLYVLYHSFWKGRRTPSRAIYIIASFCFLPALAYVSTYYAWFGRGYGLNEYLPMFFDSVRELNALGMGEYKRIVGESGRPSKWFIWPEIILFLDDPQSAWSTGLIFMNNPPVWLLAIPAAIYASVSAWRMKRLDLLLLLLCGGLPYALFLAVNRPIFLYSGLSVLPFVVILIAYAINTALEGHAYFFRFYWGILAVISVWGLYVYPLAIGASVPTALYAPLMAVAHYVRLGGGM